MTLRRAAAILRAVAVVVALAAAPSSAMVASGIARADAPESAAVTALLGRVSSPDAATRAAAISELGAFLVDDVGAPRPEAAREVEALGDRAVPGLLVASRDPNRSVRRWALARLDAMGKKTPGDCVQTKDNDVLSAVLRIYGEVQDMDALPVVLSFVNSDRAPARETARKATLAYGSEALAKLREAYANLLEKNAPDGWTAAQVAVELFAAYDKIRLQDVNALVDEGLAKQDAGKLGEAVADFDKVLARQPFLDRRVVMAPAYLLFALSIEDADRPSALAYLRKALRLSPDGPRAGQIRSEIAYLEGLDLQARGIVDLELFQHAAELDPGNAKARARLDAIEAEETARADRARRLWTVAGAVGVALILLGLGVRFWAVRRSV